MRSPYPHMHLPPDRAQKTIYLLGLGPIQSWSSHCLARSSGQKDLYSLSSINQGGHDFPSKWVSSSLSTIKDPSAVIVSIKQSISRIPQRTCIRSPQTQEHVQESNAESQYSDCTLYEAQLSPPLLALSLPSTIKISIVLCVYINTTCIVTYKRRSCISP